MSYVLRGVVLGLGSLFLLHLLFAVGIALVAPRLTSLAGRLRPAAGAWVLFALRMAPPLSALALVCGFIVPAYLQWERQRGVEALGVFITLAACAGFASVLHGFIRACGALYRSNQAQAAAASVLETKEPYLAVAGILRPRIIVSRGFLETIPEEQRDVAMRHELAHFGAADNLKRLAMLLVPAMPGGRALEQAWSRYAERAADDLAVNGDPERAALLAEVLVTVARGCLRVQHQQQPALASALVGPASELGARVERLLESPPAGHSPAGAWGVAGLLLPPVVITGALVAANVSKPVFEWIERFLLHV